MTDGAETDTATSAPGQQTFVVTNESMASHRQQSQQALDDQDFKAEWAKAMKALINKLAHRFSQLSLEGRPVLVKDPVNVDAANELHAILAAVDPKYSDAIHRKTDWKDVPDLEKFFKTHVVVTPYSLSYQKCQAEGCSCKPFRAPESIRPLVLQWQPTPRKDPSCAGDHFMRRKDSLAKFAREGSNPAALVDLTDLPSKLQDPEASISDEKKKLDTENGKIVNRWNSSKVRAVINCWDCGKGRCLYSKNALTGEQLQQVQLVIENSQYVCGGQLFDEDDPFAVQKVNLTCSSPIEIGYYNPDSRAFKTTDICIHCGDSVNLLLQKDIENENLSDGYKCFPLLPLS